MSESIAEKCGIPSNWTFGWVIDEFDASFDKLAMASLRYHLDHAVTVCEGEWRVKLESMLDEFEEINARQSASAESLDHFESHDMDVMDLLRLNCAECDRHTDEANAADRQLFADRQAVRHKFVDLMPGLWS